MVGLGVVWTVGGLLFRRVEVTHAVVQDSAVFFFFVLLEEKQDAGCPSTNAHALLPSFPPPNLRHHTTRCTRLDRESDMAALLEATRPALKDVLGKVYSMSRDQVRGAFT